MPLSDEQIAELRALAMASEAEYQTELAARNAYNAFRNLLTWFCGGGNVLELLTDLQEARAAIEVSETKAALMQHACIEAGQLSPMTDATLAELRTACLHAMAGDWTTEAVPTEAMATALCPMAPDILALVNRVYAAEAAIARAKAVPESSGASQYTICYNAGRAAVLAALEAPPTTRNAEEFREKQKARKNVTQAILDREMTK